MDQHVKEFFSPSSNERHGNFYHVIPLHEAPDVEWDYIQNLVPDLSKGWFELASLKSRDRIEFVRDFWMDKLPYRPGMSEFILRFFDNVDDIGVFITQKSKQDPYRACLVYCLKGENGFYRGMPGATDRDLSQIQKQFPQQLPQDYLAFLQIHNGFCKTTDCTGLTCTDKLWERYEEFQKVLLEQEILRTSSGKEVDPTSLIPFYESFGMPFYQCFWADWYPEGEMGNVYYSGNNNTILLSESGEPNEETLAFPTFLHWLKFYLESIV
jgi:SMI1 / KNR4 family (SUKH-1)